MQSFQQTDTNHFLVDGSPAINTTFLPESNQRMLSWWCMLLVYHPRNLLLKEIIYRLSSDQFTLVGCFTKGISLPSCIGIVIAGLRIPINRLVQWNVMYGF